MRKRSGGIHSDSIEEYIEVNRVVIQLAEAAQQHISIFYDHPSVQAYQKKHYSSESTSDNNYKDFEFNSEELEIMEEN